MTLEGLGIIGSLLGAAYAVYHSRKTRGIAEQALQLQEAAEDRAKRREQERREAQRRAKLIPEIGSAPGWKGQSLLLQNRGGAEAHHIQVRVNGRRVDDSPHVLGCPTDYSTLSPQGHPHVFKLAGRTHDSPKRLNVHVTWKDDADGGEWKGELPW